MTRNTNLFAERLERSFNVSLQSLTPSKKAEGRTTADTSRSVEPACSSVDVKSYTGPFLSFISDNPTVFHAVAYFAKKLDFYGFTKLSERVQWAAKLKKGGKYYVERNGSSLIAFTVGNDYQAGNGASMIASHVDALSARLKPIPTLSTKAGYVQLGVAPYAGGLNTTWFDRDLGVGGRVLVKNSETGKIETRLVKLGWPIARIPTLAPHFGAAASLSNINKETQMVPIIGLDDSEGHDEQGQEKSPISEKPKTFTSTQPQILVKAIAEELGIEDCTSIPHQSPYLAILTTHRQPDHKLGTRALRYPARSTWRSFQRIYIRASRR